MPLSGPDLVFVTIPGVLSLLPFPKFWLFTFMITLILLGLDTMLAIVKTIAYVMDDFHFSYKGRKITSHESKIIVLLIRFSSGVIFSTRMGYEFLSFVNDFCSFLPMVFTGLMQVYIFG